MARSLSFRSQMPTPPLNFLTRKNEINEQKTGSIVLTKITWEHMKGPDRKCGTNSCHYYHNFKVIIAIVYRNEIFTKWTAFRDLHPMEKLIKTNNALGDSISGGDTACIWGAKSQSKLSGIILHTNLSNLPLNLNRLQNDLAFWRAAQNHSFGL